ncbi:hypothetical protein BC831DRAFT_456157 [Entophlyctis helioformis]|nr:hypothetical protein BC831DRAFT_456157 [Entophlyctis helioformis]
MLHLATLLLLLAGATAAADATAATADAGGSPTSPSPSPPAECVPIGSTSSCSPWAHGFYINATLLSRVYGLADGEPPLSAAQWDRLVAATTSGGDMQAGIWRNWAGCSGYDGQPIQFYRSFVCLTDIFDLSAGCNSLLSNPAFQRPAAPVGGLCSSVCSSYGEAISSLIEDAAVCPPPPQQPRHPSARRQRQPDGRFEAAIMARRRDAHNGGRLCARLTNAWQDVFGPASACIAGVDGDASACGFAASPDVAREYCALFPRAPCCSSLAKTPASTDSSDSSDSSDSDHESTEKSNETAGTAAADSDDSKPAPVDSSSVASLLDPIRKVAMAWGIASNAPAMHNSAQVAAADANPSVPASSSASDSASPASSTGTLLIVLYVVGGVLAAVVVVSAVSLVLKYRKKGHSARTSSSHSKSSAGATPFMVSTTKTSAVGQAPASQAGSPTTRQFRAVCDYNPELPDEVVLRSGDAVEVLESFDDGWCSCRNLTSKLEGLCPVACLELVVAKP